MRIYKGSEITLKLYTRINCQSIEADKMRVALFTTNPNNSYMVHNVVVSGDTLLVTVGRNDLNDMEDGVINYIILGYDDNEEIYNSTRQSNYFLKTPDGYVAKSIQTSKDIYIVEDGEYKVLPDEDYTSIEEVNVHVELDTELYIQRGIEIGEENQKAKLESISITENGTYSREDGYNEITVEVPDLNGDYNEGYEEGYNVGYAEGEIEQKSKLETINITENGTYSKEDGYNTVVVDVPDLNGSYDEGYQAGKTDGYDEGYDVGKTDGYEEGQQNCPVPEMYSKTATTTGAYETFYPEDGKVGFSDVTVNSIPLISQYMTEFQNNGGSISITENAIIDTNAYSSGFFGFSFINNSYFNTGVLINKDTYWYIEFYVTNETLKQTGTIFGGGGFALEIGNGLIWARYGDIISEKKPLIPNNRSIFRNYSFSFTTSLDSFVNTNDTIFIGGYNSGNGGMTNKTEVYFNNITIGSDRFYFSNDKDEYNIYKNGTAYYIGEDYLEYRYSNIKGFPFNVDYIDVNVSAGLSKYKHQQLTVYSKYDLDDTYIDISNYFNIGTIDSTYMYFSDFARLKTKIDDETYRYDFWTEGEIDTIVLYNDWDECLKQLVFKNIREIQLCNVFLNGLKEIDYFNVQNIYLYNTSAPLQKIIYKYDFENLSTPYIECYSNSFDGGVYIYGENNDNYVVTFENIEGSTLVRNNLIINV